MAGVGNSEEGNRSIFFRSGQADKLPANFDCQKTLLPATGVTPLIRESAEIAEGRWREDALIELD